MHAFHLHVERGSLACAPPIPGGDAHASVASLGLVDPSAKRGSDFARALGRPRFVQLKRMADTIVRAPMREQFLVVGELAHARGEHELSPFVWPAAWFAARARAGVRARARMGAGSG